MVLRHLSPVLGSTARLLLSGTSIWNLDWSVSERRENRLRVLLSIWRLSLRWGRSTVVIIGGPTRILDGLKRVAISDDHTVIICQHLLVSHSCMRFLRGHLWRTLRLRDARALGLWSLYFWWVLPVFGVTAGPYGLLTVMVSRSRDTNVRVVWLTLVDPTASSGDGGINPVSRLVVWNLLWSRSRSRRWVYRIQIAWRSRLLFLASVWVVRCLVWALIWSRHSTRFTLSQGRVCWHLWGYISAILGFYLRSICWAAHLILIILVALGGPSIWRCTLSYMTMTSALSLWWDSCGTIWLIFDQIIVTWGITTPI